MGNQPSSGPKTNVTDTVTSAITQAFLSITQEIGQDVNNIQLVSVKNDGSTYADCVATSVTYKQSQKDIMATCGLIRTKVSDIHLRQKVNINIDSFMKTDVKNKFATQVLNSLSQQSTQKNSSLNFSDADHNFSESITSVYDNMRTEDFKQAMMNVATLQGVMIVGATVSDLRMSQASKIVEQTLMGLDSTQKSMVALQSAVLQQSTQIAEAGLSELIIWLVRIVMLIVTLVILAYSISMIFNIYTLEVT